MARTAVNRVRPFSILNAQDPQSMPSTRRRNDWLASSVMIAPRPVVPATAYGRCSNYRVKAMNLTIGEAARATGTKAETIRYYERIGLLPRPGRTAGNYRSYGADDVARLSFVRREIGRAHV